MFNSNNFKQKSLSRRFLFILGLSITLVYFGIAIVLIFFDKVLMLDAEKFQRKYQIAFAVILIVYGIIRFFRLMRDHREE